MAQGLHSSGLPLFSETRSRPDCGLTFSLSSSEQSEEEGEKKKKTKKKKASEGHREGSSSEEGSDSSSSSESEVTSEEEEQVEPASWRKKTVKASSYAMVGHLPSIPNRLYVSHCPRESQDAPLPHTPIHFFFQPPSSKSAPVAKEISLLDLEDCESGWWKAWEKGAQCDLRGALGAPGQVPKIWGVCPESA